MDALGCSYEIIFVDDGSRDRSHALLRAQFEARPDCTRVALLRFNAGQHLAILAGFELARGERIVTLDADLQNPPEQIGALLKAMDEGHDLVGTIRQRRQDSAWRRWGSRMMNRLRQSTTNISITDQGCMLRAYDRSIIDLINECHEASTFVPALAYGFSRSPVEIQIPHEERAAGTSKYSLYKLIRLNFDLMTGFSLVPLQLVSMAGIIISLLSLLFVIALLVRRILIGPEVQGVFTLFGIVFFLIGVLLLAVGLIGEYVGRIYQQVRSRPRYMVATLWEAGSQR
jgi:undecaprenyl-phosphate 4-deoxy-4-formamido-L-arabinose transferase